MILSACSFVCSRACIAQVEAKTLPRFSKLRINADVLAQKRPRSGLCCGSRFSIIRNEDERVLIFLPCLSLDESFPDDDAVGVSAA